MKKASYKYLILEGINGCLKTTIGKGLVTALEKEGYKAQFLHFPDETDDLGKVIRKAITNPDFAKQWTITGLLYAAESEMFHKEHSNTDTIFVLDRHSFTSSLVYQKDMSKEVRDAIYQLSLVDLKKNAKVFYLDVDGEIAFERTMKRNSTETLPDNKTKDAFLHNFEEFANRYTQITKTLSEDYLIPVKDVEIGVKTPEQIINEILQEI